jgi:hypothetical protein
LALALIPDPLSLVAPDVLAFGFDRAAAAAVGAFF